MSNVMVIVRRLLESSVINLEIFFVTLALGLPLGLIISFCTMSKWRPFSFLLTKKYKRTFWQNIFFAIGKFKPIRDITAIFVWIIRGTPLMLQIIVVFYGPGLLWDESLVALIADSGKLGWMLAQVLIAIKNVGRMEAALIAFVINYACYFSEIFRGGIQSMPIGQREAGEVLGMTKTQIFFKVTLLQVIKRIVPPMGNEFITLVKDTSLARIIANKEIIMMAQEYVSSKALIWPLFSTAIFFLVACGILTILLNVAEKKLDYFRM